MLYKVKVNNTLYTVDHHNQSVNYTTFIISTEALISEHSTRNTHSIYIRKTRTATVTLIQYKQRVQSQTKVRSISFPVSIIT